MTKKKAGMTQLFLSFRLEPFGYTQCELRGMEKSLYKRKRFIRDSSASLGMTKKRELVMTEGKGIHKGFLRGVYPEHFGFPFDKLRVKLSTGSTEGVGMTILFMV
jgi:hypothetical protein